MPNLAHLPAPTLTLRKCSYSRSPWRIGFLCPPDQFLEIGYLWFDRKRDALPVLAALAAVGGDLNVHPIQWPETQRAQVEAIITASPGYQAEHTLRQRGVVAPGRLGG